ncbi:MFS transporter [Pseudactinotalea sp. Z1748]|uniref:MFS transporter n=1 Tax=Pseudactinotalea sp. Z1748 TaxID=3413027 RepID=UPI003C7D0EAC
MHSSPFGALAHFKILPAISSGPAMALAVAARAPYAMVPLGTMTAITASTGSVAAGGLATGLVAIATAVAAPLIGRWADRAGQRFVLTLLTPINALALGALLLAALWGWDGPALWAACVGVGATAIPVGAFARARWVQLTTRPRDLAAAFSYESTVDELTFVLGPALVGIAASTATPAAPIALAAVLVALAGIPFALTAPRRGGTSAASRGPDDGGAAGANESAAGPGARAPRTPAQPVASIPAIMWAVAPAVLVMLCIGVFFGAVQAGTTERAALSGVPGQAGLVYALMGLTSAATALLVVMVPESVRLPTRVLLGGAGMAVFITVAAFAGSMGATAGALLATGAFLGPALVTAFSVAERRSPAGGIAVSMTSMQSGVTIGVAIGSAAGGALAASVGPEGGFGLGALASVVIGLTGLALLAAGRRRRGSALQDSGKP